MINERIAGLSAGQIRDEVNVRDMVSKCDLALEARMRHTVRLVVDIARAISRQIELESMRWRLSGELMKTMYLLQPGNYRSPHKVYWLYIQHGPHYRSLFFAP